MHHPSSKASFTVSIAAVLIMQTTAAQEKPKLWIDSTAVDTFSCGGLSIRLADFHRDDKWFGHVFELMVSNRSDSAKRFDPAVFAVVLRNGTQQTFPSANDLAERAINGYDGKRELKTSQKQDQKRSELQSRRDLIGEDILPGASSAKRIGLGPPASGGIAIGGRAAEELREFKAADLPVTLYCRGRRIGVVSKP